MVGLCLAGCVTFGEALEAPDGLPGDMSSPPVPLDMTRHVDGSTRTDAGPSAPDSAPPSPPDARPPVPDRGDRIDADLTCRVIGCPPDTYCGDDGRCAPCAGSGSDDCLPNGAPCDDEQQCAGDDCIDIGADPGRICVEFCSADGLCPVGLVCHLGRYCIPEEGEPDCAVLDRCITACGNDLACAADCQARASEAALRAHDDYAACASAEGCPVSDRTCVLFQCAVEHDACYGARAEADLTCAAFNSCLGQCADTGCRRACALATPPAVLEQYDVVLECFAAHDCDDDGACQRARCGALLDGCLGDIAYPDGNGTCAQLNTCLGECQNQACVDECIRASSPDEYLLFDAMLDCANATGCNARGDCEQSCPRQWSACFD